MAVLKVAITMSDSLEKKTERRHGLGCDIYDLTVWNKHGRINRSLRTEENVSADIL